MDSRESTHRHSREGGKVHSRLKCNTGESISEGLIRGQEAEAFARGVVVALDGGVELFGGQGDQVGFAGEVATQASDGVLDAPFLPRLVGVAEEGGQAEALGEQVMGSELGAVVESEGLAQGGGKRFEETQEALGDGWGGLVGLATQTQMARGALVEDQDGLAVFSEEHQIGVPVAGLGAVVGLRGASVNRHTVLEVQHRTSAARAQVSAARLAAGQQAVPVILLGGAMVDEAVDGLVRDYRLAAGATEAAGDLLGRPALEQVLAHQGAELGAGGEFMGAAALTTPVSEGLSTKGRVASFPGFSFQAVPPQLSGDGRRRAPQDRCDRASRFTVCMQTVNLDSVLHRQLCVSFPHGNTPYTGCCTCSVNLANPVRLPRLSSCQTSERD